MEIVYIILLLIFFLVLILTTPDDDQIVMANDYDYFNRFSDKSMRKLINNNRLNEPIVKKNKILFITYDNRVNEDYVLIHNNNILKYCKKYDYRYKFFNKCNDNTYWCKMFMVLHELKKNKYDYVIWLDSDTVIKNFDIDIGDIFNKYSSDIFIGSDNNSSRDITNAGVFIIKNSEDGINFLMDCIEHISSKCLNDDGTLKGIWAASCYEQGVMNILIHDKYSKNTTILTNEIIFNYNICSDEVFIMHLYASPSNYRVRCFNSNNPALIMNNENK